MDPEFSLTVDGREVSFPDDGSTLLDLLRERLGITSAKDGCSPQGQCGCCTVLVDGQPRVSCVTPARRVAGRTITTLACVNQFYSFLAFLACSDRCRLPPALRSQGGPGV